MCSQNAMASLLKLILVESSPDRLAALQEQFGCVRSVLNAPAGQLTLREILPPGFESRLLMCREVVDAYTLAPPEQLDAAALRILWCSRIGGLRREVFEVACLDPAGRLLPGGITRIASGTPFRVGFRPRQVLEPALRAEAAGLIVAHNHPGDRLEPTEEDRLITRAISLGATALEITFLDHLIVGSTNTFSFRDAGLI
jgi:DNA repair protein RadC